MAEDSKQFLPFDMGQVRQLDKCMNDAGLLRLMVSDPLAMNMSNTLGVFARGVEAGWEEEICFFWQTGVRNWVCQENVVDGI